jgi:hypothetical protein
MSSREDRKNVAVVQRYKDIRKALAARPTSWKLMDGVDDEEVVPQFPVPTMKGRKERGPAMSKATLRKLLLKSSPANPVLLRAAVAQKILTLSDARKIFRAHWGKKFSFKDFVPNRKASR